MLQMSRPIMTHRRLLLFKWLMVFLPSAIVAVGHSLIAHTGTETHGLPTVTATLPVTFLGLVLTYIFVETLFRVLRRLQAEALAREQDIQTMNAVIRERERLSRELHDGVAQLVADLLLRLDTIKELVEVGRPQDAEAELERLHGAADEIYKDIGESITGLRTNVTERGLICALQDYVDQFEERYQILTSLQILTGQTSNAAEQPYSEPFGSVQDRLVEAISPLAALQIFRLIQEALTNVRKHAGAREATVTLTTIGPDRLRVVIADDGRGFDFTPGSQRNGQARPLGLTSMRERVETLGGTFHVNSQPGSGTQVTATIPMPRMRKEKKRATPTTPSG